MLHEKGAGLLFYLFLNMPKRIFTPLLLLLIPVIGMILSDQINWSIFDFIIMGILLLLVGVGNDFVIRRKVKKRILYIGLIILVFMLVWAELAVGIYGSPFAGS
ncbi:hypothetical protein OAQ15_03705 [Flavobacteriaceae bacterium]|nr:hypothetical protein [Flavobacteriaceae bacterium]